MALGGINTSYDGTVPPDSENAGLGAQRIRSLETTLQQVLDSEHNFPASGGANTGYHRLGSGRVFFGAESLVSSSGTDGRLMQASDTSRLFHVGSGGTSFIGGAETPVLNTWVSLAGGVSYPQRSYWAMDVGCDKTGADGNTITFQSGFSGIPIILVSATSQRLNSATGYLSVVPVNIGPTAFDYRLYFTTIAGVVTTTSKCSVNYISIGTRAL